MSGFGAIVGSYTKQGVVDKGKGAQLDTVVVEKERENDYRLTRARRFRYRTRYFTDSGIIGGKAFVRDTYQRIKENFNAKKEKIPKPVSGLDGIYSLKRLVE